jgi:hypothetical protein
MNLAAARLVFAAAVNMFLHYLHQDVNWQRLNLE